MLGAGDDGRPGRSRGCLNGCLLPASQAVLPSQPRCSVEVLHRGRVCSCLSLSASVVRLHLRAPEAPSSLYWVSAWRRRTCHLEHPLRSHVLCDPASTHVAGGTAAARPLHLSSLSLWWPLTDSNTHAAHKH